jgi:hypothetical protein
MTSSRDINSRRVFNRILALGGIKPPQMKMDYETADLELPPINAVTPRVLSHVRSAFLPRDSSGGPGNSA